MAKKFLTPTIIVIAVVVVLFLFKDQIFSLPAKLENIKRSADVALQDIKKEIINPPPLRALRESQQALLTRAGVIKWTNIQRANNGGLLPLAESAQLDAAASRKVQDMFNRQYFEHVSPDGKNIGDLVEAAGYKYIAVGENLALGNFKDDQELVQAWMDSPGHRANILNSKFREIGVAVARGLFEGKQTWLAVQAFALPLSACPEADLALKSQIDWLERQIAELKVKADGLLNELEEYKKGRDRDAYNLKVEEYNAVVKQLNSLVVQVKEYVIRYNGQVQNFNDCLAK